jgi:hypothetical protein
MIITISKIFEQKKPSRTNGLENRLNKNLHTNSITNNSINSSTVNTLSIATNQKLDKNSGIIFNIDHQMNEEYKTI